MNSTQIRLANELIHLEISSIFFQCSFWEYTWFNVSRYRYQDEPCNFTRLKRGYRVSAASLSEDRHHLHFSWVSLSAQKSPLRLKPRKRERERERTMRRKRARNWLCELETVDDWTLDDHRYRQRANVRNSCVDRRSHW